MFFIVTNNEYQILLAIWNAGRPLTAKEIVEAIEEKSFKSRSIHSLLNALLGKGLIYVDGQKLCSKIYSRCFNTCISFEEYHSELIKHSDLYHDKQKSTLVGVFAALISENVSKETLDELESLLEKRKKNLNNENDNI